MNLTEKTLELNITHELMAIGRDLSSIFRIVASAWRLPLPRVQMPIYAAGLTLQAEAKAGWDVSIELPAVGPTPSQILFLQFKLGEPRGISRHKGSAFSKGAETEHFVFEINNNTYLNQHGRLRATAAAAGRPQAAIYALPLVGTPAEARIWAGDLLFKTAFVTVTAIDAVAKPTIKDRTKRSIAISRTDATRREIRSQPAMISEGDVGAELVAQIATVRLHREMSAWRNVYSGLAPGGVRSLAGLLIARRIAEMMAHLLDMPEEVVLDVFGIPPARRRRRRGRPPAPSGLDISFLRGVDDEPLIVEFLMPGDFEPRSVLEPPERADDDRDRLHVLAGRLRPFIDALRSGRWLDEVPPLERLDLLIPVAEVLRLTVEGDPGARPGSSHLSYVVV